MTFRIITPCRLAAASLLALTPGCTTPTVAPLTPLQIQSLQSREFEQGKDVVFPSVMSVFQDLGYIVRTADKDTGFITVESAAFSDPAISRILLGYTQVSQTAATAFIEEIGPVTRVRLNFVTRDNTSYSSGKMDRRDTPVLDQAVYANAFERIESAIFVRTSR